MSESPHTRPMSCQDLSTQAGLPPVTAPTISELQTEITALKARNTQHEKVFYSLSGAFIIVIDATINNIVSLASRMAPLVTPELKSILSDLSRMGLDLIASAELIKKRDITPNIHLLSQDIQDKVEIEILKRTKPKF